DARETGLDRSAPAGAGGQEEVSAMANFYLAVFIIGFALSVISFAFGVAGHSFGHGGDLGPGGHGQGGDAGAHGTGGSVPVVNFGTVTAFMTWFGGIGFLLTAYSHVMAIATV